jgi:hypothetical protein
MAISKSLYDDYQKARADKNKARKSVKATRITKSGKRSLIPADTYCFCTFAEAQAWISNFIKLNPTRNVLWEVYEEER